MAESHFQHFIDSRLKGKFGILYQHINRGLSKTYQTFIPCKIPHWLIHNFDSADMLKANRPPSDSNHYFMYGLEKWNLFYSQHSGKVVYQVNKTFCRFILRYYAWRINISYTWAIHCFTFFYLTEYIEKNKSIFLSFPDPYEFISISAFGTIVLLQNNWNINMRMDAFDKTK